MPLTRAPGHRFDALVCPASGRRGRSLFVLILALGLLAAPLAGEFQTPARVHRSGYFSLLSATNVAHLNEAFRQGLRGLGYVEGQTIAIESRSAEWKGERLPKLADEVIQ